VARADQEVCHIYERSVETELSLFSHAGFARCYHWRRRAAVLAGSVRTLRTVHFGSRHPKGAVPYRAGTNRRHWRWSRLIAHEVPDSSLRAGWCPQRRPWRQHIEANDRLIEQPRQRRCVRDGRVIAQGVAGIAEPRFVPPPPVANVVLQIRKRRMMRAAEIVSTLIEHWFTSRGRFPMPTQLNEPRRSAAARTGGAANPLDLRRDCTNRPRALRMIPPLLGGGHAPASPIVLPAAPTRRRRRSCCG
jgi:hypothetical protein